MLRRTFLEVQRKAGQYASASSGARGYLLHEAAQCTALRPAASVSQVAFQTLVNNFGQQPRQGLRCCTIQVLTPANEYSSRAYWWPQSSGFAAQADQEGSASPSPDSGDGPETSQAGAKPEQEASQQENAEDSTEPDGETISYDELEPEELRAELLQRDTALAAQAAEIAQYKDRLIRTLADMENSRQRSAQQAENSKRFAVQGFAKAMLDVADNLERAVGMVEGRSQSSEEVDLEKTSALLTSLHDGVKLTDKILLQAFKQNGIEQLNPLNEPFDPNLHNALFEAPMPDVEPGTIHTIVKAGYTLNGRVLRAAEVGVAPAQR